MAALARKRLASTPVKETDGTSNRRPSAEYMAQWPLPATDEVLHDDPSVSFFGELLSMSQEEFGFAGDDGRITLPCESLVMEYMMCLLTRDASEEVKRLFLSSMARPCHYGSGLVQTMHHTQRTVVPSF